LNRVRLPQARTAVTDDILRGGFGRGGGSGC